MVFITGPFRFRLGVGKFCAPAAAGSGDLRQWFRRDVFCLKRFSNALDRRRYCLVGGRFVAYCAISIAISALAPAGGDWPDWRCDADTLWRKLGLVKSAK